MGSTLFCVIFASLKKLSRVLPEWLYRMSVSQFQQSFLHASSSERAQLIFRVSQANPDLQIGNLLQNLDINYRPNRDSKAEAAERRRPTNIYFVCQMLQAFPNFRM